jgi:hypothetical protein
MISMERRRSLAFTSAALGTAFLALCGCSDSQSCTTAGCSSGAWLHIPLSADVAGQANSTVTVCRSTECYSAALPAVPDAGSGGASLIFSSAAAVVGTLSQNADQTLVLDLEWYLADASQAQDGDHYVVTFTNLAGVTTTLLDKMAAYQTVAPNGETCGPICSAVELTP